MVMYSLGHTRGGRRVAVILVLLILALLTIGVSRARALSRTYFAGLL